MTIFYRCVLLMAACAAWPVMALAHDRERVVDVQGAGETGASMESLHVLLRQESAAAAPPDGGEPLAHPRHHRHERMSREERRQLRRDIDEAGRNLYREPYGHGRP